MSDETDSDEELFPDYEPADDDGDPFAELADAAPEAADAQDGSRPDPPTNPQPESSTASDDLQPDAPDTPVESQPEPSTTPDDPQPEPTAETAQTADPDDPFGSFPGAEDTDEDLFEAFESPDVEEIDPDAVWDSLATADDDEMPEFDGRVYYQVSKHKFCERCEYFSEPPDTECTYDGAAIIEFLDMETVELLNCPVVAQKRKLEENVNKLGSE